MTRLLDVLAALLLAGVICACNDGRETMKSSAPSTEEVLGLTLPAYAAEPHFHVERGMGLLAYLKLEIPSDKLDELLRSSPLFPDGATAAEEPIRFASYNTGQPWWTPAELESPAYGSKTGRRDKWQTSSFVAVERQGDRTLVYFMYFEEP
jgi:hypothetical protein